MKDARTRGAISVVVMLRYCLLLFIFLGVESLRRGFPNGPRKGFPSGPRKSFPNGPTVRSPAGTFRGKVLKAFNGRPYYSFRGIPYAVPPVGDLRFAKPLPIPRIKGLFNAQDFGPICIQPSGFVGGRGQEDCLTLNVFTPTRTRRSRYRPRSRSTRRLKEVLVYSHGGGIVSGSSREYLPGDVVSTENLVVVTYNYRLGLLGALRGHSDQLPGNQNIYDTLLVLQWIQDNIKSFGGDPHKVTFFGQGSGGFIGQYIAISPLGKGLFRNAIFTAGFDEDFPVPPRKSNDLLITAIDTISECKQPGYYLDVEEAVACLKSVPARYFDLQYDLQFFGLLFSSEDEILPRRPQELWTDPVYLDRVGFSSRNYLSTISKDDGLFCVDSRLIKLDLSTPKRAEISVAKGLDLPVSEVARRLVLYRKLSNGDDLEAVTGFFTDIFRNANELFLEALSNATEATYTPGKGYILAFDQAPSFVRDNLLPYLVELVYFFDLTPERALKVTYPQLLPAGPFTKEEELVRRSFIDAIADFVRTGDPGKTLRRRFNVDWRPYDNESNFFLSFSSRPKLDQDLPNRRFRDHGRKRNFIRRRGRNKRVYLK